MRWEKSCKNSGKWEKLILLTEVILEWVLIIVHVILNSWISSFAAFKLLKLPDEIFKHTLCKHLHNNNCPLPNSSNVKHWNISTQKDQIICDNTITLHLTPGPFKHIVCNPQNIILTCTVKSSQCTYILFHCVLMTFTSYFSCPCRGFCFIVMFWCFINIDDWHWGCDLRFYKHYQICKPLKSPSVRW